MARPLRKQTCRTVVDAAGFHEASDTLEIAADEVAGWGDATAQELVAPTPAPDWLLDASWCNITPTSGSRCDCNLPAEGLYRMHDFYVRVCARDAATASDVVRALQNSVLEYGTHLASVRAPMHNGTHMLSELFEGKPMCEEIVPGCSWKCSAFSEYFSPPPGYVDVDFASHVPHGEELGYAVTIDVPCPLTQQLLHGGVYNSPYTRACVTLTDFYYDHGDRGADPDLFTLLFYPRRVSLWGCMGTFQRRKTFCVIDSAPACIYDSEGHVAVSRDGTLSYLLGVLLSWDDDSSWLPTITTKCIASSDAELELVATRYDTDPTTGVTTASCTYLPTSITNDSCDADLFTRLYVNPVILHYASEIRVHGLCGDPDKPSRVRITILRPNMLIHQDGEFTLRHNYLYSP